MASSIKINYLLNLTNTISGLLFQLITFPYISRILLADGIGHVNFFQSIIQYISILTSLGIPMYAIRQVAKVRDNINECNKTTLEILSLHLLLTLVGYTFVALIIGYVNEVNTDIPLFLILSLTLFFTAIGCEWFYQGIEEFKYITIRSILVKVISLALLLIFVKEKSDIYTYAWILIIGTVGSNVFNFIQLRKYLRLNTKIFKELQPFRHIKPVLKIFALNIITSIYVHLNTIMLGFMSTDASVGFYTTATKISHFILSIGSALGIAMLPKMSNLISNGKLDDFKRLSSKSMAFTFMIFLPMTFGLAITAPSLIFLLFGDSFIPAVFTLQIIAPIAVIISMSNVAGIQTLYPQGKENFVIFATGLGALANVLMNIWLIPKFDYNGAAVSTLCSEFIVTFSMLYMGKKYLPFNLFNRSYMKYMVSSLFMVLFILPFGVLQCSHLNRFIIQVLLGGLVYFTSLLLLKDELIYSIIVQIKNKLKSGQIKN